MTSKPERDFFKSLSDKWFELLLITVVLAITLAAHLLLHGAPVIVHFFYLPVIIAAYYFGRNLACLTAVFSVLSVVAFALLDPERYLSQMGPPVIGVLTVAAWAGFMGINALLVGTLCDQRVAKMQELREAHLGIIEVLSKYLQAADGYTKTHSMRVADLSEAIASELGMKQADIEDVRVGALLHDIGKVEISTKLIQKAAGLNDVEKEEMDSHTVRGADLVRSLGSILEGAVPTILHHHDHYSATSKSEGLHGDDIPLGARVVAVADAYDAIVTDRPYRRGRTPQEAVAIIHESSGTQFDSNVVSAFERVMARQSEEPEHVTPAPVPPLKPKRDERESVGV